MKIKIIFIVLLLHSFSTQGAVTLTAGTIAAYDYMKSLWDERWEERFNPPAGATFTIREEYWRLYILEIINSLAPELYNEIIKIDPMGRQHIINQDKGGIYIRASSQDYLPVLFINQKLIVHMPRKAQRALIAHELAHYALSHDRERDEINLTHRKLFPGACKDYFCHTTIKGRKVQISGSFHADEVFQYSSFRVREYEADRYAVLQLEIPYKDLVRALELTKYRLSQHIFRSTHPSCEQRIEHLESLRPEVELQKAHGQESAPINWKALVELYKKSSWNELQEAL